MAQNAPKKIIKVGYLHTRVNFDFTHRLVRMITCYITGFIHTIIIIQIIFNGTKFIIKTLVFHIVFLEKITHFLCHFKSSRV